MSSPDIKPSSHKFEQEHCSNLFDTMASTQPPRFISVTGEDGTEHILRLGHVIRTESDENGAPERMVLNISVTDSISSVWSGQVGEKIGKISTLNLKLTPPKVSAHDSYFSAFDAVCSYVSARAPCFGQP